jgi:hypothetical protein
VTTYVLRSAGAGTIRARRRLIPARAITDGIVVEEFVLADDHTAVGLRSAGWTAADRRWWSSAEFGRAMRADPALRRRVAAAERAEAETAYRRLGGGDLPDEPTLHGYFRDYEPLATSAPLLFGTGPVPDGYQEKGLYRVLFAGELTPERLADLRAVWHMETAEPERVAGTARLPVGDDLFTWDLRRIGEGIAWCLDVTAYLGAGSALGPLLRELTAIMRRHGMIPVTVERFA